MLSKILKLSLLILFIVVSVSLYETDRKYSDLKKKTQFLLSWQITKCVIFWYDIMQVKKKLLIIELNEFDFKFFLYGAKKYNFPFIKKWDN